MLRPQAMKPWVRRTLLAIAGLAGLSMLAWLSVPAWAPLLAGWLAPDGWRLEQADIRRPTFSGTRIDSLRARGVVAGMAVSVTADDVTVTHRGPVLHLGRLAIELAPAGDNEPAVPQPWRPAEFSIPRLLAPGDYPTVRVDQLTIAYPGSGAIQHLRLIDLEFDSGGAARRIETGVEAPPGLRAPLFVVVELGGSRLEARVSLGDPGAAPALAFIQESDPLEPRDTMATLGLDLDLSLLEPTLLASLGDGLQAGSPDSLAGRVQGELVFRGQENLSPVTADLALRDVRLVMARASLAADTAVSAVREGDQVRWSIPALDVNVGGALPPMTRWLKSLAADAGVTGLFGDGDVAAGFALLDDTGKATGLAGELDLHPPHALALTGDLALSWQQGGAAEFDLSMHDLEARLSAPAEGRLSTLSTDLSGAGTLRGDLRLALDGADLSATNANLGLDLRLSIPERGPVELSGTVSESTIRDFRWSDAAMNLAVAQLDLRGRAGFGADGLSFDGPLAGQQLDVEAGEDLLASAASFAFDVLAQGDEPLVVSGAGQFSGLQLPGLGIRMDGLELDLNSLELPAATARLHGLTTGLEARLDGALHTGLDLDLGGVLEQGERFLGSGEALLGYSASLPFGVDANLGSGALTVRFDQAELPGAALRDAARALAVPLPEALKFTGGTLSLDGTVALGEAGLSGGLDVQGDALALALGESDFEGLTFATRIDLADVMTGGGPMALDLARLAAGLDLVQVNTQVDIQGTDDLGLLDLDAGLLGGALSSPALRMVDGRILDTEIEWRGFDLGRLLSFVDVNGLEGSGTVDAHMPVVNEPGGLAVHDGRFEARGPGHLRYSTGAPATNIGLQALENFQYDSLSGEVDYFSDGSYTVAIDLLGRNPDLYGGHPIRFRLNLGGAMPALFRSLFVTGDFERAIIERLRAGKTPLEETPQGVPADSP